MSSPYGLHRVIEPEGVLPQQAWRLSTEPGSWPDEVLVDVERLNLDAASYRQLREEHGSPDAVRRAVAGIIEQRGKMHNPVTGSGGMLLGTVREVGERRTDLRPGSGRCGRARCRRIGPPQRG